MDLSNLKKDIQKSSVYELSLFAVIIWLAFFYFKLVDFIHEIGMEIGEALAR